MLLLQMMLFDGASFTQIGALLLCFVSTRLLPALRAGIETKTGDAQHCNVNMCLTKWQWVCSLLWAG